MKKKSLAILLSLCMMLSLLPLTARAAEFSGLGTEADPYLIETAAQLAQMAELVNAGNAAYKAAYYKLMNNLSLADYGADWNENKGWIPIGHADTNGFSGHFDGNGKVIAGLYIDHTGYNNTGLFGLVTSGSIKKLGLADVDVSGGYWSGGLLGYSTGIKINDCWVTGAVSGRDNVGGLAGYVSGNLINCYVIGSVTGTHSTSRYIGGVVGRISGGSAINCYATGAVSGRDYVGGLVGSIVTGSKITNCAALNISVTGVSNVGRIVGYHGATLSGNIAFVGMLNAAGDTTWDQKGLTARDGADVTADALQKLSGFPSGFDAAPWLHIRGKLPGHGAPVVMPEHLRALSGIVMGIEITVVPDKTVYDVGEALDLTGLVIAVTYGDDDVEDITSNYEALGVTFSGFDSSVPGTVTVTAAYEGYTDTFTVTVIAPIVVDKTALAAAIAAFEALNEADYTIASWSDAAAAYADACLVYDDPAASQEAVDAATAALNDAIARLVLLSDVIITINNPVIITVRRGQSVQLTVTTTPEGAALQNVWSSANSDWVSVDENGVVTALVINKTVFVTVVTEGGSTATIAVRVIA